MKHEKEIVERQRKQQREEKKKQKLEKLKEQFSFFESEVLTKNLLKELRTCWEVCLLYTSPSPRDGLLSRMPSSA